MQFGTSNTFCAPILLSYHVYNWNNCTPRLSTDFGFLAFWGRLGWVRGWRVFLQAQQGAEVEWSRFGGDLTYSGHWVWQEELGTRRMRRSVLQRSYVGNCGGSVLLSAGPLCPQGGDIGTVSYLLLSSRFNFISVYLNGANTRMWCENTNTD